MKNLAKIFVLLFVINILTGFVLASEKVATDPSRIGVGARLLGMGKGYIAQADDLYGIFINPAALASLSKWQLTSMQGKFINEYDYLNAAYAVPTRLGTFGIGYVGSGISFIGAAATQEVIDGVRIIPSTTEGVAYNFSDQVLLLSWGNNLTKNVALGATVKFFSLGMSGPGISNGSAAGREIDLGLVFRPNTILGLAAVYQNALSFDAGGKISWANGSQETLRSTFKLGLSLNLLGPKGLFYLGDNLLTANIDRDIFPKESAGDPDIPSLWHTGLEWSPSEYIDLRLGIDQDIIGTGGTGLLDVSNNFTSGIGLYFDSFRFDYAYHQYNELSDNDTHYFSLTYGVDNKRKQKSVAEKKEVGFIEVFLTGKEDAEEVKDAVVVEMVKVEIPKVEEEIVVPPELLEEVPTVAEVVKEELVPVDEMTVYDEKTVISGRLTSRRISKLMINGVKIPIKNGKFTANLPLNIGKNLFVFQGFDKRGQLIDAKEVKILRMANITDLAPDYWAKNAIEQLVTLGILGLYPDGTFRPEEKVSRIYFLMDILRAGNISSLEVVSFPFTDVALDDPIAPFVLAGYEAEITKGYPNKTFRPWEKTSRAEGVVMIVRFSNLTLPSRLDERPYEDVGARHWAIKEISTAKERSMIRFVLENFDPDKKITRAEMASSLAKVKFISDQIDAMMNWDGN
ncbi:MAG: S-layer homology domain-containing protein [bacterium]